MEILEAYDSTKSFRSTAALCGMDHRTVRRYVDARAAGLDMVAVVGRTSVSVPFSDEIKEWIENEAFRI